MSRVLSGAGIILVMSVTVPAYAQSGNIDHSAMPGMDHSSMPGVDPSSMPGMDHGSMPGMNHDSKPGMQGNTRTGPAKTDSGNVPGTPAIGASGTALPAGSSPAPGLPMDHYADRQFGKADMDRARDAMMHEQGGQPFYLVMLNLAELQLNQGQLGYRWDGEAWFGGDINRFTFKSEGGGGFREGFDNAEVQGLYSYAIGPYFNLQAGVRQDLQAPLHQTYATFGFEGLAPYWFEVSGAVFVSTRGNVLGRLEGYYDQNITQRLILQPRVELNFAAQNTPEEQVGVGFTNAELGLRLRYEITREFAPYVGVSYDTKVGQTAAYASQAGRTSSALSLVAGVRVWF
jgi:copper resistance protein B